GYFSQSLEIDSSKTIYEELLTVFNDIIEIEAKMRSLESEMSALKGSELEKVMQEYSDLSHELEQRNGFEYQCRIRGVIKGLGFGDDDFYKPINTLSGGQKTRIALGRLLLSSPDLLLLDEPTNHLDIESIQWLEDYLNGYPNSIIVISHDRYFLNKVTKKTIEIENGKSTVYFGNYSHYIEQKQIERDIQQKHYINQQKEIKHQQQVIDKLRSFIRVKSIKRAESREKQLEKMERAEAPENLPDKMRLIFKPARESGNDVLTVNGVSKSFDGRQLFENISFEVKKGEKVALVGANGIGKTTLFRIIMSRLMPDSGKSTLGANVFVGYYDQEQEDLDLSKTIFDEISDTYPNLSNLEIRNALAAFVFTGDDVFKTVSTLSGGEKGRVMLAKIMLGNANFLILDEPTNHLDLNSKEILEKAINAYEGTVLYISHDRYFINSTATRLLEITPNGINNYLGNYDFYIESLKTPVSIETETVVETQNMQDWKRQKEEQAAKRKIETKIKKIEKEIAETEEAIKECDELLSKEEVYSSAAKSAETYNKKTAFEEKLMELYEQWEELNT
ncbi:MAG: ABC-F family ATP-binding cassette domain-containing protein, partial [Firmicutes bacterium]|nr:ABC-F family ATP-binding cassette domain-containing protein [Bacillota bacterium]